MLTDVAKFVIASADGVAESTLILMSFLLFDLGSAWIRHSDRRQNRSTMGVFLLAVLATGFLSHQGEFGTLASRSNVCFAQRQRVIASATPSAGDRAVLEAVGALKRGEPAEASALLRGAREAYRVAGGPSASQSALLDQVESRVQVALVAQAAAPPSDPLAARVSMLKLAGDEILQEALRLFNAKEYSKAREAVQRARESFAAQGARVTADREVAVGNLYSLIAREEERQEHLKKIIKLKKLAELKEQKGKAKQRWIDS